MASVITPLHIFRFQVDFYSDSLSDGDQHEFIEVCSGAFSECTGLEATMEPKVIKEGGRNYGAAQRAGGITFATVVLKRGISTNRNLWQIFNSISSGMFAPRLQVVISLLDGNGDAIMGWQLDRAMPIKFKFADLNAKGTEVGIEELHLVHEGLSST
ncbi:MAG TPA: phage tail protein [Bryobacteraceae bacterium]|nr:phage tail protein [Bryobacteraceae bacterium]